MKKIDKYRVLFFYSADDKSYLATIPDLPGCIADGETVEDAVKAVKELAVDWVELAEEDGEAVPEPMFEAAPRGEDISIFDVAVYILQKTGVITTKALQKLLYYCKAWSCGWFGEPLFPEQFEAWRDGPVNRALYYRHAKLRLVSESIIKTVDTKELSAEQKTFVDEILDAYRDIDPDRLGEMTHMEKPWIEARRGLEPDQSGDRIIEEKALCDYYG